MRTIVLPGNDPEANLAEERRLFEAARGNPSLLCLFYINRPCIIAGRNNLLKQWVNLEAAERDGIPVLQRFTGGGTVYHDKNVLTYSFIAPRDAVEQRAKTIGSTPLANKFIALFVNLLVEALSALGPGFAPARTSDINLNGRKVSGNAQRIARQVVLHHGTLMRRCPVEHIERYLPIPPDRPGIDHRDFITGLHEQGINPDVDQLVELISGQFARSFGETG